MCLIVAFYVCLFPLKIWNLVLIVGSKIFSNLFQNLQYKHYWLINITTRIFFYINSSINPILYNFLSKKFRLSFSRIFLFKLCLNRRKRTNQNSSKYLKSTINSNFSFLQATTKKRSIPFRNNKKKINDDQIDENVNIVTK